MSRLWLLVLLPVALCAQGRPPFGPWWDGPVVNGLNLSEAQRKQIQTTTRDFRNRLVDARASVQKAEGELDDVFNSDKLDQRRANDAINRLANARGELTKVMSQMSLQLRQVLTAEQWQELQRRERGPQRLDAKPGPEDRRGPGGSKRRRPPPPDGVGGPGGPPPRDGNPPPGPPPNVAPPKPVVQ
jgi:Spy/CpxP family protein refolding chaperone